MTLPPRFAILRTALAATLVAAAAASIPLRAAEEPCGDWSVDPVPVPAGTVRGVLRDVMRVGDAAWAVGEVQPSLARALPYAARWTGSSWEQSPGLVVEAPAGDAWATFDAVAEIAPGEVWAAGGRRIEAPDGFVGTHILVARHREGSWTVLDTPVTVGASGANVRDIHVAGPADVWLVGDWVEAAGPAGVARQPALAMHWDGSGFTVVDTPYPANGNQGYGLEAVDGVAPDDLWAVGGFGDGDYGAFSYVLHWDGTAWTRVEVPNPGLFARLFAVDAIAANDVWATGAYVDPEGRYRVWTLHWDGGGWSEVAAAEGGSALAAVGADEVYASGAGLVSWRGSGWVAEAAVPVADPALVALAGRPGCDVFAVGRRFVGDAPLPLAARLTSVLSRSGFEAGTATGWSAVEPAL